MLSALREERIDVAVIWSVWPETFCFTAYEAMAAGAFVVTSQSSGNVSQAVSAHGSTQGCCLGSEDELVELFRSGKIFELVHAPGRRRGEIIIQAPVAEHIVNERMLADA